jgi:NAD(P)-dependent dehydrogenase (short-subunit alcohol dehydrogenase family)
MNANTHLSHLNANLSPKSDAVARLENHTREIRRLAVAAIYRATSGHPGGSLSCADLLAALYGAELNITPATRNASDRNRFVLSKGHAAPAHYAASKAGLISLAQVVARFGAKWNIRSNVVAEGLIQSEMAAAGMSAPAVAKAAETILLGRLGTPDEVGDAVVFLAGDAARYITAQTLNVYGGLYF